jgi:hypothetical protein
MASTYEPIATTTLGSAASEIHFNSVPATYTDLVLICTATATTGGASYAILRLNEATAATYSRTALIGDGSSATSNRTTSQNAIELRSDDGLGMSASIPTFMQIDVFSYAGSTFKTVLASMSNDLNGSGGVSRIVGLCQNTAAITKVSLFIPGNTFKVGTTATLYGIKNA